MNKPLITRIASAVAVLVFAGLLFFFFREKSLRYLCYITSLLGARELSRILFKPEDSFIIKVLFFVSVFVIFILTAEAPDFSTLGFACVSILFCSALVVYEKQFEDLGSLATFQAKSLLGFFYVGLLPGLACRILDLPHGPIWFITMLAIVFAGDTFAYFIGMTWGNKKILPAISPKKTVVGALGGLLGSTLIAMFAHFYLPHIPFWSLAPLGFCTGVVAQLGDLFESMLKRVANRKDSGTLMPGHGGILDRLDGVLFGAPLLLAGALLLEKIF